MFSIENDIEGGDVVNIKPLLDEINVSTYSTNPCAVGSNVVNNVNMTGNLKSEMKLIKIERLSYSVADYVQYTEMETCQSP